MKRVILGLSSAAATIARPALAQQQGQGSNGVDTYYGHPMMWDGSWSWHPAMFLGPLTALFVLFCAVAFAVWLFHELSHRGAGHEFCPRCGRGRSGRAGDILAERFARGEIGKDEFEEKRRLLAG